MTNETIKKYVKEIEQSLGRIAKIMEAAKEEAGPEKEHIKAIYKRAKDAGEDVKALRQAVKVRAIELLLDSETRQHYDQIRLALGDLAGTPLGEAAVKSAKRAVAEMAA